MLTEFSISFILTGACQTLERTFLSYLFVKDFMCGFYFGINVGTCLSYGYKNIEYTSLDYEHSFGTSLAKVGGLGAGQYCFSQTYRLFA